MKQLDVIIMGQSYKLVCKEGGEDALREAVAYLDGKMRTIRDAGKIKGNDRIAVMAALGVAIELLATKSPQGPFQDMTVSELKQKMDKMQTVLDQALTPQENLF
jgi:cell division protein ZapA